MGVCVVTFSPRSCRGLFFSGIRNSSSLTIRTCAERSANFPLVFHRDYEDNDNGNLNNNRRENKRPKIASIEYSIQSFNCLGLFLRRSYHSLYILRVWSSRIRQILLHSTITRWTVQFSSVASPQLQLPSHSQNFS